MTLILTGPPAAEPVTLADAKAWLRLDGDHEDELVASLVASAREQVERLTGLALIDQTWRLSLDAWPAVASVALSRWPVAGILELMVWGEDDEGQRVDPAHYYLDNAQRPAELVRRRDRMWPRPGRERGGIEVTFRAGFGSAPADVPPTLRHAVCALVAAWYENREAAAGPYVASLVSSYLPVRLA